MLSNRIGSDQLQESNLIENKESKDHLALSKLLTFLSKNNECYVLIRCGKPSALGKMQVEMTYEGDPTLASYLIESASNIIEETEALKSNSF